MELIFLAVIIIILLSYGVWLMRIENKNLEKTNERLREEINGLIASNKELLNVNYEALKKLRTTFKSDEL